MLTFKDSVTFLASQLCRKRQQGMSFAKVESWVDADPDPGIDTKNQKHLLCHTRLHMVKPMPVQNEVPSCYAICSLLFVSMLPCYWQKLFHLDSQAWILLHKM